MCFKTGQWVRVHGIPELFKDRQAMEDVVAFRRFQRLGWPYGPWGLNPAPYVDLMDTLMRIDEVYHPRQPLF